MIELAKVLEVEKELEIIVEGHTDTDKLTSPIHPKTNWELSDFIQNFNAKKVSNGFSYNSGDNTIWETVQSLRELIYKHLDYKSI